ncbi:MAG: PepSY domain-containing protein [Woeseiaceae bacterium]
MIRKLAITLVLAIALSPGEADALAATSVVEAPAISKTDDATYADKVTLEQAVRRVRKQYGGRILSAETRGSGGRRQHVIKVLTDEGRVRTVRINAN